MKFIQCNGKLYKTNEKIRNTNQNYTMQMEKY